MTVYLLYSALGLVAGYLAGLLGVGGGLIIVPALAAIFSYQGHFPDTIMHYALGTSLATIVFTSLSSIRAHHKHKGIDWSIVGRLTPGLIIGSLCGAFIAGSIDSSKLTLFFGIFAIMVALQMMFVKPGQHYKKLPGTIILLHVCSVFGIISALVGIGGGSMTVPFLVWHNYPVKKAVAISAAAGFPIALGGVIGYIWMGKSSFPTIAGYVNLPAFVTIVIFSMLMAPVGARHAHSINPLILKRVFSVFLFFIGLKMLIL